MLFYNLRIALKSLRRNPALTAVVIGAIALGISVSTTFIALRHTFAKDPLPGKSDQVFYVRLDNWDPARAYLQDDPKSVPTQVTYRDMRELMKSTIPTRQSAQFETAFFVFPEAKAARPYNENVRMVFGDFFEMFDLPFKYGSGWDKGADAKPEQVIVIDHATNEKLFGGANSVGRTVRIEDRNFKVSGVLEPWRPPTRFYDPTHDWVAPPEAIYMPFNLTVPMQIQSTGNRDGWKTSGDGFEGFLQSESVWIQFWVELPTPEKQQQYRDFVDAYVLEQKKIGRFGRPLNNKVTPLAGIAEEFAMIPPQVTAMAAVSLLFLVVCSLNLVGLLLGKFLARVPEVSVRRALGASRAQVFWQHIVECEVVGVLGGAIGIVLSIGILAMLGKLMPNGDAIGLDAEMVFASVFLSLIAGMLAGLYPAWRVCTVAPAMQLKVQ